MQHAKTSGGLIGRGLVLAALCGTAGSAMAVVGGPIKAQTDLNEVVYNQGGRWRPALIATRPAELPGPFVQTADSINGEQIGQILVPPAELFALCFDPANPPSREMMDRVEENMRTAIDEMGIKYQIGGRWSGTYTGPSGTLSFGSTGDPIVLTWSLMPDGVSIPGSNGEPTAPNILFADLDGAFASQGGRATWINRFNQIWARWSQLTGITYVRISGNATNADADDGASWGSSASATRGQVRIASHSIDGASGVLAYNFFPGAGTGGNMVLDSDDSANWASTANNNRFFRNTLGHEHGHGMGLSHVCPAIGTKLMEPFLNTGFDGPRQDDIRSAQRNYGDPSEPDNSIAQAKDRGALNRSNTIVLGLQPAPVSGTSDTNGSILSIDADGEQDYHFVTPTLPTLTNITVTPKGSSYADYAQDANCNTTTVNTNALQAAQLAVDIRDGAGNVLATATATLGSAVTISNVFFGAGTPTYIRVFEANTPTQVQLYNLTIQGLSNNYVVTASDGVSGGVNVSWTAVTNAANYQILRNTTNSEVGASVVGTVGAVTSFADTTAAGGQTYFYFVRVKQTGEAAGVAYRSLGASDSGWTPCLADVSDENGNCGSDQQVDLNDFFTFLAAFDQTLPCADIDGNPGVDLGDFFAFLGAFDQGC